MPRWVQSVLLALTLGAAGVAEAVEPGEPVTALIERMGDSSYQAREAATAQLIAVGVAALPALRAATSHPDAEIAHRAALAIAKITLVDVADRVQARAEGRAAFVAGDYERMASCYERLTASAGPIIDDFIWLGHCRQVTGRWEEAVAAYVRALDLFDVVFEREPALREAPDHVQATDRPFVNEGGEFGQVSEGFERSIHDKLSLQRRIVLILRTGLIERDVLDDPAAAAATLARIFSHVPWLGHPLEELEDWYRRKLAGELEVEGVAVQPPQPAPEARTDGLHQTVEELLKELADAQAQAGQPLEALRTWRRIMLHQHVYFPDRRTIRELDRMAAVAQRLPAQFNGRLPMLHLLRPEAAELRLNLDDPATLAGSFSRDPRVANPHFPNHFGVPPPPPPHLGLPAPPQPNAWIFPLLAPPGLELASLEVDCDATLHTPTRRVLASFWVVPIEENVVALQVGQVVAPPGTAAGRHNLQGRGDVPLGARVVGLTVITGDGEADVHQVTVRATFRPATAVPVSTRPRDAAIVSLRYLPAGGTLTMNGQPIDARGSHFVPAPAAHRFSYTHPQSQATVTRALNVVGGGRYCLFLALDQPGDWAQTDLTRLRLAYAHSALAVTRTADGGYLAAWSDAGTIYAPDRDGAIRLAHSRDGVTWSEPRLIDERHYFGRQFACRYPALFTDRHGTLWLAYFTNQFTVDFTGFSGLRMYLRHSVDGRTWSPPRLVVYEVGVTEMPQEPPFMSEGPDGTAWLFWRAFAGRGPTLAEVTTLQLLNAPFAAKPYNVRHTRAAWDAQGRMHLVWHDTGPSFRHARRGVDGRWSRPATPVVMPQQQHVSVPRLLINDGRMILIYNDQFGTAGCAGSVDADGNLMLGEAVRLTSASAPLQVLLPPDPTDPEATLTMFCGDETYWRVTLPWEALPPP